MLSSKTKSFKRNLVTVAQNPDGTEDDPCKKKEDSKSDGKTAVIFAAGMDPRFQQQDQTLRCFVMYVDSNRCEHLLGQGHEACLWFKLVTKQICPNSWVQRWDEFKEEGRMPWHRPGKFAEAPYGK